MGRGRIGARWARRRARFRWQRHRQQLLTLVDARPARVHRVLDDAFELDSRLAQLEPVVRDAGEIEQIVDEPDQLAKLALHRFPGLMQLLAVARALP